ncbi:zinc finger CCCH-type with G patch domain-containing protein [Anoplophora glabripennis]|uniref:zinc finger CCCH-type with G patch domain-containing protein n=1 Tax=Anoplophora glabripennis TaxID=217634 RepID=UPI0008744D55|nr:zinc finger CCCH-type with G patch domain-containing protein [Anoplophora glabripennis]
MYAVIMNSDETSLYKQQLLKVNEALLTCPEGPEKEELIILKESIQELLLLTDEPNASNNPSNNNDPLSDEFALFMAEMEKEGAVVKRDEEPALKKLELNDIEGKKCRAPHKHQWGNIAYHNAMICSVEPESVDDEMMVRVLFINPTHQEMLPCPYYYESDCKFTEDKCRFSHGELVTYSSLQEYIEPKFDLLSRGSYILAKQKNNLWYRAIVKKIYEERCLVKFESNRKEEEVILEHIFPLNGDNESNEDVSSDDDNSNKYEANEDEDIINMSLMITPSAQVLGDWERYTKGMGSKLMQKMGYIVGTGLGKKSEGRIEPVTAMILPQGKSLDHCMKLREQAGNDKDLFSVERKLKRLQRKQEMQCKKAYERQSKEVDVFNFINKTLGDGNSQDTTEKIEERQKIKKECSRSLNIKSLQIADNIRKVERDLERLKDSLARHTDVTSNIHLKLKDKLVYRQDQLKMYQTQALMIRNEQSLRSNKKKMTVF